MICEDIPTKFLYLIPVDKWELDCLFKRMMKSTKTMPPKTYNAYRCGVFFNIGWLKYKCYDMNNIYQRDKYETTGS